MFSGEILESLALIIGLVIAIVIGLVIFQRVQREARGEPDDRAEDPLSAIQAAYKAGHMDEAEFQRARDVLNRQAASPKSTRGQTPNRDLPEVPSAKSETESADEPRTD